MLDLDPGGFVIGAQCLFWQVLEKLGQTGEKAEACAKFAEAGVGDIVHAEVIEQAFHVSEFSVPLLFGDERVALFPKLRRVDAEFGENHVVLHVAGTERLVVVVNQRDGVLGSGHGKARQATRTCRDKEQVFATDRICFWEGLENARTRGMSGHSSDDSSKLVQTIGPWQILFYGLGSMLGAGVYVLIGKAAGVLGNAVWLAFVAAMIAALLTGLSYASVGSRYPKAGGAAYVTQRAYRKPWLSYTVGIAVMMSGLTSMATGLQAIAESLVTHAGIALPVKLLAVLLALMVGAVIYRGIRESMWVNLFCTFVEVGGLLFIIAVGAKFWGGVDYWEVPPQAAGVGIAGISMVVILQGAVLTFFSFIGFEDILNVSEEVKEPRKSIPFGLVGAMIAATVIYMAVAITAVSVIPWSELSTSSAPLMEVAKRAAPWFGGIDRVYLFITIFSIGNTALLNYLMGSRLLYGMSRQGLMPKWMGRVHPVRRTPHVAVGVLFLIVTGLIVIGGVKQLAEATALLLLSVFVVVNLALLVLKFRKNEARGGFEVPWIVPVLGAIVCSILIISRIQGAITSPDPAMRTAPIVAAAVIVASLILHRILKPVEVVVHEE